MYLSALMVALLGGMVLLALGCSAEGDPTIEGEVPGGNPIVVIETSMGTIEAELFADAAPKTVKNILQYVDEKFYDYTIFHRVMSDFMIQGGGFDPDMNQKTTHAPVDNEAGNGLKNVTGTLAMARTSDVNSAMAQFFINVVDNGMLDHRDTTSQGFGYAVFGKVVAGMDVVNAIRNVRTHTVGRFENVPREPVIIKSIRRK
jgi:cyclophilin family peptidyl-prolyl cis-trans isomerase